MLDIIHYPETTLGKQGRLRAKGTKLIDAQISYKRIKLAKQVDSVPKLNYRASRSPVACRVTRTYAYKIGPMSSSCLATQSEIICELQNYYRSVRETHCLSSEETRERRHPLGSRATSVLKAQNSSVLEFKNPLQNKSHPWPSTPFPLAN